MLLIEIRSKNLYHATFKKLLPSIKKNGLGNTKRKNWSKSKPGVIYLAYDKHVAESYAETADNVPEKWLDEIVILKINQSDLDPTKLKKDENVIDGNDTLEYHGIIPFSLIRICS